MLTHFQVYHALTDDDVKTILNFSEKYVMMCCYKLLFCPHSTNDEEKDLEIQNRIRCVNAPLIRLTLISSG
jgi:hypothetical protein